MFVQKLGFDASRKNELLTKLMFQFEQNNRCAILYTPKQRKEIAKNYFEVFKTIRNFTLALK